MAVPTFTAVDPAVGYPGGGQVVTITGTNFRTASAAVTWPAPEYNTVSVTFDGIEAEMVQVLSATEMEVRVPDYRGDPNPSIIALGEEDTARISFPPVDIVITNLDDDGVAIGGETVTEADAYTYRQPLLRAPASDPPLLAVLIELMKMLQRQVVSRVHWQTFTDFGLDGELYTELSEHPSIGFEMAILRDPEYSQFDNEPIYVANGDEWIRYESSRTYMLVLTVTISAQNPIEAHHLVDALLDVCPATPWVTTTADAPFSTLNRFPLEMPQFPAQISGGNRSNITAFNAVLRVRGIPVIRTDPLTDRVFKISTLQLSTTDLSGDNAVTADLG